MQTTESSKPTARTSRTHTATGSITNPQSQRFERLFMNSPSTKTTDWNPNYNDADIINGRSLLNIQATHAQHRRERRHSSTDDRIVINVCGNHYETHRTTLELYPDTLLGNAKRRKYYYDKSRKEYFFDRHRASFEAILYYYQSNGRLRRPDYVSLDIFLEEVTFFQLGQEALSQLRKTENIKEVKKVRLPKNRIRRYIWATMEYPDYSCLAKIVNIISLLMILISTIAIAIETLPQYVHLDDLNCEQNIDTTMANNTDLYTCPVYYASAFFLIQVICVGYFTIELILRIISTPSLFSFVKNLMNWIDLIAVIPFYVTLAMRLSGGENDINSESYTGIRVLRILRLARVFKFFRVFKGVKSLRVLATTVRQSLLDFFIMIIMLTLLGFLFGSAAYYAENSTNGQAFDSTIKATYWGIITITSVGYGDIMPITVIGRVISCLCALFGAATIGMLVSVLVDRYQRVYSRKLFIKEDVIDFDVSSDEDNNDIDSIDSTFIARHRENSKIEDPDARAKEYAEQFNTNPNELVQTPDSHITIDENPLKRDSSRVHLIIGYVDNENHQKTEDLVEKISSIIADKQSSGDHISLNIIPNENDVQFQLQSSDEGDS